MRLRIAVFGVGRMGTRHLRAFAPLAEAIPVDPPRGWGAAVGRLDGAVVAVPPQLHAAVALPLLRAGVPCLVEKPLGTTFEDAEALATFAHVQAGFVERWNPVWDEVPGAASSDREDVFAVRWAPPTAAPHGLDVVRDLLIHDLDLLRARWGEPPTLEAVHLAVGGGAGPDAVDARLRSSGGGRARLCASRLAGARRRSWTLGSGPLARDVDLLASPRAGEDALTRQARAFLEALAGRRSFSPGGQDGLDAWRLARAVLAAC